ncbi:MAG: helix-turn-helix transcriptional regulator [Marinoscillum sp.]
MKSTNLGEFEELVMLTVGLLQSEAYGLGIKDELARRTGRTPSIGALHSALTRLEEKGFLKSEYEGATDNRRGRRKRFYQLTSTGLEAVKAAHELRSEMIQLIPNISL